MKKTFKKILNKMGYGFKSNTYLKERESILNGVISLYTSSEILFDSRPEVIIFSKDRPLQLKALLDSLEINCNTPLIKHVLYSAKNSELESSYSTIFSEYDDIVPYHEESYSSFRDLLLLILEKIKSPFLFFLVDDIIFVNKLDLENLFSLKIDMLKFIPSLRLGQNITESYMTHSTVKQPNFIKRSDKWLEWEWSMGERGWGYPHSVDGNIFLTEEIKKFSNILAFKSPNTYESSLAKIKVLLGKRKGICPVTSCLVNIPCNKVQNDNDNESGQISIELLLEYWNKNMRIDILKLQGFIPNSTHMEIDLPIIKKEE